MKASIILTATSCHLWCTAIIGWVITSYCRALGISAVPSIIFSCIMISLLLLFLLVCFFTSEFFKDFIKSVIDKIRSRFFPTEFEKLVTGVADDIEVSDAISSELVKRKGGIAERITYLEPEIGKYVYCDNSNKEKDMEKNLQSEQGKDVIENMIEKLNETIKLSKTCVKTITHFGNLNMVRIKLEQGFSVCISTEGKSPLAVLYETLYEVNQFIRRSLEEIGWNDSFGPSGMFNRERLSK